MRDWLGAPQKLFDLVHHRSFQKFCGAYEILWRMYICATEFKYLPRDNCGARHMRHRSPKRCATEKLFTSSDLLVWHRQNDRSSFAWCDRFPVPNWQCCIPHGPVDIVWWMEPLKSIWSYGMHQWWVWWNELSCWSMRKAQWPRDVRWSWPVISSTLHFMLNTLLFVS
jgi:hypothetical protein